jgi:hypothetical protein
MGPAPFHSPQARALFLIVALEADCHLMAPPQMQLGPFLWAFRVWGKSNTYG